MLFRIFDNPKEGLAMFFMLILAISLHEMAHAWMALRKGDDTAALMGRLTLNPVVHFDPMGFMCIMLMTFGWGKPVMVNPLRLRDVRKDSMFIALAGPASNILQAFALGICFRIFNTDIVSGLIYKLPAGDTIFYSCFLVFFFGVWINLALAFFNLIPLFPLDGEKILAGILPYEQARKLEDVQQHGMMILFGLIILGHGVGIPILSFYINTMISPFITLLYWGL